MDQPFYLGPWYIEPQLNRISSPKENIRVEPKVMQLLMYLAQRPDQVVSREELLENIWGDVVVADGSLSHTVSKLRHALSDNSKKPQFIETISKTGYRLVGPVNTESLEKDNTESRKKRIPMPAMWALLLVALGAPWFLFRSSTQQSEPAFSSPQPLTSMPGRERDAALSPNGHHVAFAWAGAAGDNMDIYVKTVDEETPLQVTKNPAIDTRPVWSPDGQRIAFLRYDDGGCTIFIASLVGGSPRKLTDCGANKWADLAWSPDGKWLVYPDQVSPDTPYSLYLLAVETLERRKLTYPETMFVGDHAPAFSPDGESISFIRSVSLRVEDLYVISLSDTVAQRLTHDDHWLWGHTWTPNGKEVVFSSSRSGFFNLWRIHVKSGALSWVPVTGGESLINPMISPQSEGLVYEQWHYDANIWQLELGDTSEQAGQPKQLIASTQWDSHPKFSPDGNYIAFVSRRSGQLSLWMCNADSSNPIQLTTTGNSFDSTFDWVPDGKSIVFSARHEGFIDLYTVNVENQKTQRLTSDESVELNPVPSNDGHWIYFASDRSGSWQIWKMALSGGKPVQVTKGGGMYAMESRDGQRLYFTRHNADGLWTRPVTDGAESQLIETLSANDWGNWSVGDNGIYFLQKTASSATLMFWDASTASSKPVLLLKDTPMNRTLTISPDSKTVLYAQMDQNESDLMLVENFK